MKKLIHLAALAAVLISTGAQALEVERFAKDIPAPLKPYWEVCKTEAAQLEKLTTEDFGNYYLVACSNGLASGWKRDSAEYDKAASEYDNAQLNPDPYSSATRETLSRTFITYYAVAIAAHGTKGTK